MVIGIGTAFSSPAFGLLPLWLSGLLEAGSFADLACSVDLVCSLESFFGGAVVGLAAY